MLDMAHKQYGKLPWATLFQPAIRLAEEGFPISRRLHLLLLASDQHLRHVEPTRSYFYQADGTPKAIGTHLRNLDYAHVLKLIATRGRGILPRTACGRYGPGRQAASDTSR